MSTAKPGEAGEAAQVAVLSRRDRAAIAALLGRYLDRIEHWTSRSHRGGAWRHSDFYRHRKSGAHLSAWHDATRECRDAIVHVRALRLALFGPTHAVTGDRRDDSAARAAGGSDV